MTASPIIRQRYEYGAYAAAEVAATLAWVALWLLNGLLTVLWLAAWGLAWWWGCLAHVVISLIEHHLWRSKRGSKYPLIVIVGSVDVYSSALGVLYFLHWAGLQLDPLYAYTFATIVALAIAIAPEPNIIGHLGEVWTLTRKRHEYAGQ